MLLEEDEDGVDFYTTIENVFGMSIPELIERINTELSPLPATPKAPKLVAEYQMFDNIYDEPDMSEFGAEEFDPDELDPDEEEKDDDWFYYHTYSEPVFDESSSELKLADVPATPGAPPSIKIIVEDEDIEVLELSPDNAGVYTVSGRVLDVDRRNISTLIEMLHQIEKISEIYLKKMAEIA